MVSDLFFGTFDLKGTGVAEKGLVNQKGLKKVKGCERRGGSAYVHGSQPSERRSKVRRAKADGGKGKIYGHAHESNARKGTPECRPRGIDSLRN